MQVDNGLKRSDKSVSAICDSELSSDVSAEVTTYCSLLESSCRFWAISYDTSIHEPQLQRNVEAYPDHSVVCVLRTRSVHFPA
jgi:hypothetical protein